MNFPSTKLPRRISIPSSCIRSPGALLVTSIRKCLTDPEESPVANQKYTSDPASNVNFFNEEELKPFKRTYISQNVTPTSLDGFLKDHSFGATSSPGQLKDRSDDISKLIEKAKKACSYQGVELCFDIGQKNLKYSRSLLEMLIFEVCLFPKGFLSKISLKKLIVCDEPVEGKYFLEWDTSLVVSMLDTKVKILDRFYKIVFYHIASIKHQLIQDWEDIKLREGIEGTDSLEEVFVALMKNLNYALIKPKIKKLQDLLGKHFPKELSEEWFQNRNKAKKKTLRVSFGAM